MTPTPDRLRQLGEPIVKEAFEDLFSSTIPSQKATRVLRKFSRWWTDYSRAALMVLSCEAVGGDPAVVRHAAKALVLAGGAFDLHDDIIDRSFLRTEKRRKSIQARYGMEATLLAGDALLIAGLIELTKVPEVNAERARRAVTAVQDGLFELGSAEMEELRFVRNLSATPRSYLRIVRMKGADAEAYTRVGAILGGGTEKEIQGLGDFGRYLGMICIVRDDIVDLFNDAVECRSRLMKESLPLPLLYALGDSRTSTLLRSIWSRGEEKGPTEAQLEKLIGIIHENQGFEKGQAVIDGYIRKAKASLASIEDPTPFLALFQK